MKESKRTTVVNKNKSVYDVYIGRGSKWGNPFIMGNNSEAERNRVCDEYEKWFWTTDLPSHLHELKGKRLGCFCSPKRCHGDFLAREANKLCILEDRRLLCKIAIRNFTKGNYYTITNLMDSLVVLNDAGDYIMVNYLLELPNNKFILV